MDKNYPKNSAMDLMSFVKKKRSMEKHSFTTQSSIILDKAIKICHNAQEMLSSDLIQELQTLLGLIICLIQIARIANLMPVLISILLKKVTWVGSVVVAPFFALV
jgi:hypothetical protein